MDAHHMPKAQTGRGRGNHGKESAHRVPSVRKVRVSTDLNFFQALFFLRVQYL